MVWREIYSISGTTAREQYVTLAYSDNNVFHLKYTSAAPLSLGPDSNLTIRRMQIGSCFSCNSYPRFPKYLRGKLFLYYNKNQNVMINLYSNDLRPVAIKTPVQQTKNIMPLMTSKSFLLDGRIIPDETVQKNSKHSFPRIWQHPTAQ
jgi:hypothetical protein